MRQTAGLRKEIKRNLKDALTLQGYELRKGRFQLLANSRDEVRKVHSLAKKERLNKRKDFILRNRSFVQDSMVKGSSLKIENIEPRLQLVESSSKDELLFRWWNCVWWSLPYERAYGRQMRYVVWDEGHQAAIGLIGLQSPLLSWSPRDTALGISTEEKDYWVNQSMSIQRLGALPPYNTVLGGKLVAMLAASDTIRHDFQKKYAGRKSVMRKRQIPARLLFATTTGAFGHSSIYNRLKYYKNKPMIRRLKDDSKGTGSFHIPDTIYTKLLEFLQQEGVSIGRGYGHGPSRKMRLIDQAMRMLGYSRGNEHGVKRAIYLLEYVINLKEVMRGAEPEWCQRPADSMVAFWKERWAQPERIAKKQEQLDSFSPQAWLDRQLTEEFGSG